MKALNATGGRVALVAISLSMIIAITAVQVHLCPCYGHQNASIVAHAGTCFIIAWHNASASGNDTCMKHYSLAALVDPHLRLAVAHQLKQEPGIIPDTRVRVALDTDGANDTTWHWATSDGRRLSANTSGAVLWLGEGHQLQAELHTSAVLDLDSGQLVTANVDETLPALRTAPVRSAMFSCAPDVSGAAVDADLDMTVGPVALPIQCERRCYLGIGCTAYSLATIDGTERLQCVLHNAYSPESVRVSSDAGGQYCAMEGVGDDNRKLCPPLSLLGGSATVDYSTRESGMTYVSYEGGTVATVSCDNGTYFYHNRQTQVQVVCDGQSGHWLYWDEREYMCIKLTKLWLWNAYYATKWQEWQPGAISVGVPQGSGIPGMTPADAFEPIAVHYKGYFYFTMTSLGQVYRVDPATRSLTRQQPDIAADYRCKHAAGALAPDGRLLVCGGHVNVVGRATCFVHWLATGVTRWSASMLGSVRWGHSMCYYRHRIYVTGGWDGGNTLWDVQSVDAATLSDWRHEPHMAERRFNVNDGVTVFRGRLYVCGGYWETVDHTDTCEFFDGATWTLVPGTMRRKIYCGSLNSLDDRRMYYAGGHIRGIGDQTYVSVFDAETQTWSDEPHGLFLGYHRHCAIGAW